MIGITAIAIFFGAQLATNRYGDKATLFEAFLMTLLLIVPLLLMSSDWMYYNQLVAKGAKINYYFFHLVCLLITLFVLSIVSVAIYNGL